MIGSGSMTDETTGPSATGDPYPIERPGKWGSCTATSTGGENFDPWALVLHHTKAHCSRRDQTEV